MPAAPPPLHTLRTHSVPIASTSFSHDNALIYAGDQDGYLSITDAKTRRAIAYWKAHTEGILGVQEWDNRLISHGRDNFIHIHEPLPPHRRLTADRGPAIWKSLAVNALNFCRFTLLSLPKEEHLSSPSQEGPAEQAQALLAVPGLLDSELCDIYHLPSMRRLHAAVNTSSSKGKGKGKDEGRTGLIMSMHLGRLPMLTQKQGWEKVGLVLGFEDGRVEMWGIPLEEGSERWKSFSDGSAQVGKRVWERMWETKGHNEAVMGMAVASDLSAAYTVSADHLLMKHDLNLPIEPSTVPSPSSSVSLRSIGHSSLAISANNAILAVGGWDGAIRLFSSKSLKPLGTLKYHREGVQALAFASAPVKAFTDATASAASTIELDFVSDSASAPTSVVDDSDSGSDTETEGPGPGVRQVVKRGAERGEAPRWRWLVSGSKDRRMAIWGLMDFGA